MKQGLHPELKTTKVVCNGCGTTWETKSTVDQITVEICSNCHPFYTGKQKLVDVAGRVDRFKAHREAATTKKTKASQPKAAKANAKQDAGDRLKELKKELESTPKDSKTSADKADQ